MRLDVVDKYEFAIIARYLIYVISVTAVFIRELVKAKRDRRKIDKTVAYVFVSAAGLSVFYLFSLIFKMLYPFFGRHPMSEIILAAAIILIIAGLLVFAVDAIRARNIRSAPRFASRVCLIFSLSLIASLVFYYVQDLVSQTLNLIFP